jgi:putative transposase
MKRAHKIRLYPNNKQTTMLKKHCGVARLTYNQCLERWCKDYEGGIKHNFFTIKKWWNKTKIIKFPYALEVSKWAGEEAIRDLGDAFKRFFKKQNDHPTFRKKGVNDSFRITGSVIKVEGKLLKLPKGLHIKMAEELRFEPLKIYNVTVSRTADMWFVSIQCEVPESESQAEGAVGIDLGVTDLATLSDGTKFANPKAERKFRKKIARAQRNLHRKQKGSKNRRKAQMKLARVYYKSSCYRSDYLHKMTSAIANKYATVCLEDLNVKGMLQNHCLARAISDAAMNLCRNMLLYKAQEVRFIGRFDASSKICHVCDYRKDDLKLSDRHWTCAQCGASLDRDVNAAKNVLRWATSEVKPVDCSKSRAKQELNSMTKVS